MNIKDFIIEFNLKTLRPQLEKFERLEAPNSFLDPIRQRVDRLQKAQLHITGTPKLLEMPYEHSVIEAGPYGTTKVVINKGAIIYTPPSKLTANVNDGYIARGCVDKSYC